MVVWCRGEVDVNQWVDVAPLNPHTVYAFRVRAHSARGESEWSELSASARTPLEHPGGVLLDVGVSVTPSMKVLTSPPSTHHRRPVADPATKHSHALV